MILRRCVTAVHGERLASVDLQLQLQTIQHVYLAALPSLLHVTALLNMEPSVSSMGS
jgi:hypothetical protein